MTVRNAVVAGQFYPGNPDELRKTIEAMVTPAGEKEDATGIVIPHAGYVYSGQVTADVLSRIAFPDTFVIIGPNHTGEGKPFSIMTEGTWKTPLGEAEIDSGLAKEILSASKYLEEDDRAHASEHSIELQLPFLLYFKPDIRFVPVILGSTRPEACSEIGRAIAAAVKKTGRKAVIAASSDMNHYESQERTNQKDEKAIGAMLALDAEALVKQVREYDITMCGYAAAATVITAVRELGASSAELVRYRTSGDVNRDFSSVVGYAGVIFKRMSPLVRLAKLTVEDYVTKGTIPEPEELTPEMREQAGVFVSIHKHGELRGCIGTFEPTTPDVAREVVQNAVSSATRDPRFPPIAEKELKDLEISVDVLTSPEPVGGPEDLDPKRYGVIVQSGYRKGLLLPDLEGVDTVEYQIDICRQKAGISPNEPVKLFRFEVKRYR